MVCFRTLLHKKNGYYNAVRDGANQKKEHPTTSNHNNQYYLNYLYTITLFIFCQCIFF